MAFKSSGQITHQNIIDHFGGTKPFLMSTCFEGSTSGHIARGIGMPDINTEFKTSTFYGKERALIPGLVFRLLAGYFNDNPAFWDYQTPERTGITTSISSIATGTNNYVAVDGRENYSVEWFGYFYASNAGSWTFATTSDDASYVWVGNVAQSGYTRANATVDNGGAHGMVYISRTITLSKGYHPIRIQFGEAGGGDNIIFQFTPPGGSAMTDGSGTFFYPTGFSSTYPIPLTTAKMIKDIYGYTIDQIYHMIVNGVSTPVFCLMDNKWDGGGWMLLMKAAQGATFSFNSTYWTDSTTTLNPTSTNTNIIDAKFNTMNHTPLKDVLAIWPDVSQSGGGSIPNTGTWTWLLNNWNGGSRITFLSGVSTANRRTSTNPRSYSGFSDTIWSSQVTQAHVIGGSSMYTSPNRNVRWGFIWNNESDFSSIDAIGGIGIDSPAYSAGDWYGCCGTQGLNRMMAVLVYGR